MFPWLMGYPSLIQSYILKWVKHLFPLFWTEAGRGKSGNNVWVSFGIYMDMEAVVHFQPI